MTTKATGIVAYITLIGWIIAFLAGDKEGAKFHLNQALVLALGQVICGVLVKIPFIGIIFSLVSLAIFVCQIIGLVCAIQEKETEIPVIGSIKILK